MRAHIESRSAGTAGRSIRSTRFHSVAFAVLAAQTLPAFAMDYAITSSIDEQVTYTDNLRMSETDKMAVSRSLTTPVISFTADSENTTIGLNTIFYFNRYSKDQYDSNDQNIGLSFAHKFERSTVSLNANLVRESTITSETLASGVVDEQARRTERYVASPSWQYYVTDADMLQLQASYTKQDYSTSGYTPYQDYGGGLDWIHIVDERLKLIASLQYSEYKSEETARYPVPIFTLPEPIIINGQLIGVIPDAIPRGAFGDQSYLSRIKDKGLQLGADYQLSENNLLQARLGTSWSDRTLETRSSQDFCSNDLYLYLQQFTEFQRYLGNCDTSSKDRISTAQLSWTWTGETQSVDLSGTKQSQPTANGYTVDSTQINTNWGYKITELDLLSAELVLLRNRAIGDTSSLQNSGTADRNYGSMTLSYRHQFGENWFVSASYGYARQKYLETNVDANAKTMSLTIRYRPQEFHWAR